MTPNNSKYLLHAESSNLLSWKIKLMWKCWKLQSLLWPLEAASKNESIPIGPHINVQLCRNKPVYSVVQKKFLLSKANFQVHDTCTGGQFFYHLKIMYNNVHGHFEWQLAATRLHHSSTHTTPLCSLWINVSQLYSTGWEDVNGWSTLLLLHLQYFSSFMMKLRLFLNSRCRLLFLRREVLQG